MGGNRLAPLTLLVWPPNAALGAVPSIDSGKRKGAVPAAVVTADVATAACCPDPPALPAGMQGVRAVPRFFVAADSGGLWTLILQR